MGPSAESVLAAIDRLSDDGLPLADFVRASLAEMRTIVPFDVGAACLLSPEAQYERFVACWPDWAVEQLEGRAFSTATEPVDLVRDRPEGAAFRAADWPGSPSIASENGIARLWSVPFLIDGDYFGSLSLGRREEGGRFSPAELDFGRAAAARIAVAARREVVRLHVKLRMDRATALSQLAMMVNAGEKLEAFYAAAMPVLRSVLPIDFALLKLTTDEPHTLRVVASDLPDLFPPGERNIFPEHSYGFNPDELSIDVAAAEGKGQVAHRLAAHGFGRVALAPLVHERKFLGVVALARHSDYAFSEAERGFLELFAALITQAVITNRRIEEAAAEAIEQGFIARLAETITSAATVDGIAVAVQTAFAEIIPESFAAYSYLEGNEVVTPVPGRAKRLRFESGPNLEAAVKHGQFVPPRGETGAPPETAKKIGLDTLGAICYTAAIAGGAPIGILLVSSRKEGYQFSERELRIFRLAARMLGPAMENVRKVEAAIAEAEEERLVAEVASVAAFATNPIELSASLQAPFAKMIPGALVGFGCIERKPEGDEVVFPSYRFGEEVRYPLVNALAEAVEKGHSLVPASGEGWTPPLRPNPEIRMGAGPIAITASYSAGIATGLLGVRAGNRDDSFAPRQFELFKMLANIIGTAMANVRATEQLARENALHQLVLTSLSEAVILFDHDFRMAFTNEAGELLLRAAAPRRPRGGSVRDVPYSILPEDIRATIVGAFESGQPNRGRASLTIAGEPHWFDYENIPLNHRDYKLLLVASDVTAEVLRANDRQRHRDQLEQSNRLAALGELVSGVAHELNNPLTAILGFSEVLLNGPINAATAAPSHSVPSPQARSAASSTQYSVPVRQDLEIIHREAGRARDIVHNLLAVARPNVAQRAPVDVAELIAHVAKLRSAEWARNGVEATIDCSGVTLPVWADAQQLTQVLLNLVVNAEQALIDLGTPPTGPAPGKPRKQRKPRLHITAQTTAGPSGLQGRDSQDSGLVSASGRLRITVTDNGHGMDEATRRRIFEPFFTTKQGIGTGLGLSLSYSIATSHNGTLTAESRPNRGSTFTLTLPIAAASTGYRVLSTESVVSPESSFLLPPREKVAGRIPTRMRVNDGTPNTYPVPLNPRKRPIPTKHAQSRVGILSTEPAGEKRSVQYSPAPPAKRRVLVIDDEPNIGKLCVRLVTALGHECETAASTSAALANIANSNPQPVPPGTRFPTQDPGPKTQDSRAPRPPFDLIVCDYRLGAETADDVIEGIRQIAPELLTKVVIATGATTDAGVRALCDRYNLPLIAKPYGAAEIARVLAA